MVRHALPIIINLPSKLKSQEKYKNFIVLPSTNSEFSTLAGTKYHGRWCMCMIWIVTFPTNFHNFPLLSTVLAAGKIERGIYKQMLDFRKLALNRA